MELQRKSQLYHKELMEANRNSVLSAIALKHRLQHTYPNYPTPAPVHLPNKNITSGSHLFFATKSEKPFETTGSLATFPQHHYSGGVLKNYKYARYILDRRAQQMAERVGEQPTVAPRAEIISPDDQSLLDMTTNITQIIDDISVSDFNEQNIRRAVASLVKGLPAIDDPNDLGGNGGILSQLQNDINPGAHRAPLDEARQELYPKQKQKASRYADSLTKMINLINQYAKQALTPSVRPLAERREIVSRIAKYKGKYLPSEAVGLYELSKNPPIGKQSLKHRDDLTQEEIDDLQPVNYDYKYVLEEMPFPSDDDEVDNIDDELDFSLLFAKLNPRMDFEQVKNDFETATRRSYPDDDDEEIEERVFDKLRKKFKDDAKRKFPILREDYKR
jgi:hypothetical protein